MTDTFKPTEGVAAAAKRALRWIKEGHAGSGFTDVGRQRASQLANSETVSLETVKRMYSYFSRHEVDKKGKDFNNLEKPSPGRVAWDAWGGDAGFAWAKRIVESTEEKAIMATSKAQIYCPILKSEKQEDGSLLVSGIATDSSIDSDQQICDPEWLKSAMPNWFKWGNIREQHSHIAAGVAEEYEVRDGQHWVTARVVDSESVKKVEAKVLKGFSIGISSPRVIKDNKAAGGRIIDGEIVEISLVDRPANPGCVLSLAKAIDGVMHAVEKLEEKVAMEDSEMTGEQSAVTEVTDETKALEESSQKPGEESSQEIGEESSRPGGVAGVAGKGDGMCASCGSAVEKMGEMLTMLYDKMCGPKADDDVAAEKSQSEDIAKAVKDIAARVSDIESTAKSAVAPVRTAVGPKVTTINPEIAKAANYRSKAMSTTDPRLSEGYMALAIEIEKSL
jgi:hypothetical protein